MKHCCKVGGETPQEWLVKATWRVFNLFAFAALIGVLCYACSREQDDVYQDPYDVKVGQQSSEQVELADKHEGLGCDGVPSIFVKRQDLKEFRDENFCKKMAVKTSSLIETTNGTYDKER